jgi:hypothetical protein
MHAFRHQLSLVDKALRPHAHGYAEPPVVDLSQFRALLQAPAQVIDVGFRRQAQNDDQRKHERFSVQGSYRDRDQNGVEHKGGA